MKKLVISTGAGMSAESGIRTFRDSDGLWEEYPVMDVASADGYRRNPALIHKFYNERRHQLVDCRPNAGHLDTTVTTVIDGHYVRPHIVFFQESVPNFDPAVNIVAEADVFVIIGTSLVVYPAAALIQYVRRGVPIFYIDPHPAAVPDGVEVIRAGASEGVKILKERLATLF